MNVIFLLTAHDLAVALIGITIAVVVGGCILSDVLRRRRCPHDKGISETSACHAICRKCGQDLGFIGSPENKIRRQIR